MNYLHLKKQCVVADAKRLVTALLLLMLVGVTANAVPAKPGLKRPLTLADGSTVNAQLIGDEFGHYWLGQDGKAYQAIEGSDIYTETDGSVVSQRANARRAAANRQRTKRLAPRKVGEVGNYIGAKKGIIILVNFSNVSFKTANNNALYQRIANEENFTEGNFKGSMYDYFYAQSEGLFELTFDVVGPYTVSNKQSYYGSNNSAGDDKYPATMVIEALIQADNDVNFADYDWNGDGIVEQVYVVYAGKGEADGGATTTIWPHEWTLDAAHSYGDGAGAQTLDGVTIDTYACGPELNGTTDGIAGIGTMCHEFSHCLGYPDFYDTDYSGGQGMGYWDLMDSGSYNDDGYQPAGFTSYERMVAGWKTPVTLTATKTVTDMKALQDGGKSYIIYNNGHPDEFYLLENRQLTGWDTSLPGAGLLILHVDYDADVWNDNEPNDTPSRQRMTWVAADNQYQYTTYQGTKYYTFDGMANDPFPYGTVKAFGPNTTPAATLYNENSDGSYYLDSSVEGITQNADGTISFNFVGKTSVEMPTFSVPAGHYLEAQAVVISCETEGAVIYYTTDGTTPTTASSLYTSPITISENTTLQAIAVLDGEESFVASVEYIIGTTLFYESLTRYSGNSDSSTALLTSSDYFDYSGWKSLTRVYAGGTSNAFSNSGGCLKLGTRNANGTMTTGNIPLTGKGTLTFYLKQYGSDTGVLNVTVTGATADATQFTPSSEWDICTVNLTKATGSVTVSLGTTISRAYLDEITLEAVIDNKQDVTMAFSDETVTAIIGEAFTAPTLTIDPEGLTVSYSSDNNDVATVDAATGIVTILATGTAVITASFAGDDTYNEASASYTITVTEPPTYYALVTDASTLTADDQVLITYVSDTTAKALGSTQNSNNRPAVDIILNNDGTLTPDSNAQVITIEKDDNNFLFNVGNGYLYAASSNANYLRTETTADDNAKATITIDNDGFATITFQGSYTHNTLRYNPNSANSNPLFSCYGPNSTTGSLPQLYRKIVPVTLANTDDNSSTISSYGGKVVDVTLSGRTFNQNGYYNTLCLPFDLDSFDGTPLANATVKALESSSYISSTSTLKLTFTEVTAIEAGKPYIVKWTPQAQNTAELINDPTFSRVTMSTSSTPIDIVTDAVTFKGCYDPLIITNGDRSILYMGANSTLYYPSSQHNTYIYACRAYFKLRDDLIAGDPATAGSNIMLDFGDLTTAIKETPAIGNGPSTTIVYTIDGRRVNGQPKAKGLYIVNGQKVLIK